MGLRVDAVELYGRVHGTNRSRVFECSDGHHYVVKNQNGTDGKTGLLNELLASLLLKQIGITTPEPAIVNCSQDFLEQFPHWRETRKLPSMDEDDSDQLVWEPGLCFGSRIDLAGWKQLIRDNYTRYLPERWLKEVKNVREFVDVAVFDAWCFNGDSRQAVFVRPKHGDRFLASFIDHGRCFAGHKWDLGVSQRYTVYESTIVYDSVFGLDAFEEVISRIRDRCSLASLRKLATQIPTEWFAGKEKALDHLLCNLSARRKLLVFLMEAVCNQTPKPFKNWSNNWRLHPQNAFLPDSFVKIPVSDMPRKKIESAAQSQSGTLSANFPG